MEKIDLVLSHCLFLLALFNQAQINIDEVYDPTSAVVMRYLKDPYLRLHKCQVSSTSFILTVADTVEDTIQNVMYCKTCSRARSTCTGYTEYG